MIRQVTGNKSCQEIDISPVANHVITRGICQVVACRVSGDNISSEYMACDRIVAEHNQAELNKLECTDSKQYLTLERLASLPGQLGLKCE